MTDFYHFFFFQSMAEDPTAETRTKKREPGKISKAIKLGVVGDGIVIFILFILILF